MGMGIRTNWIGLKVRIDSTKKLGIIKEYDGHYKFTINIKGVDIDFTRQDFTVLRNQDKEII